MNENQPRRHLITPIVVFGITALIAVVMLLWALVIWLAQLTGSMIWATLILGGVFALIALIGGQGTVMGPVIGAVVLVPLSEYLSATFAGTMSGLNLFLYGVIMMLVVYFMPHGLCEYIVKAAQWIEEKLFGANGKKKQSKAASK